MPLPWLESEPIQFPPLDQAMEEPAGLLAAGGSLDEAWLLHAYSRGIFPWFEDGQPILWWSPDPRLVLFPNKLAISRSLRKFLNKHPYTLRMDSDFAAVIRRCGQGRKDGQQTWITAEMEAAYLLMHERGHAHSVEIWDKDELVGGLYGIALGKVFFGESMFSLVSNASKLALAALAQQLHHWGFVVIDCQVSSEHLLSLGAEEIPRASFCALLEQHHEPIKPGKWNFDSDFQLASHAI